MIYKVKFSLTPQKNLNLGIFLTETLKSLQLSTIILSTHHCPTFLQMGALVTYTKEPLLVNK